MLDIDHKTNLNNAKLNELDRKTEKDVNIGSKCKIPLKSVFQHSLNEIMSELCLIHMNNKTCWIIRFQEASAKVVMFYKPKHFKSSKYGLFRNEFTFK